VSVFTPSRLQLVLAAGEVVRFISIGWLSGPRRQWCKCPGRTGSGTGCWRCASPDNADTHRTEWELWGT